MFMQYGSPLLKWLTDHHTRKSCFLKTQTLPGERFFLRNFPPRYNTSRISGFVPSGILEKISHSCFLQKNQIIILLNKEFTITSQ